MCPDLERASDNVMRSGVLGNVYAYVGCHRVRYACAPAERSTSSLGDNGAAAIICESGRPRCITATIYCLLLLFVVVVVVVVVVMVMVMVMVMVVDVVLFYHRCFLSVLVTVNSVAVIIIVI